MEITKDILYVGVNDHLVDLFEGQYDVPNGMAYNSYLICDDKIAVMDSVDAHFTDEWITKIAAALGERTPDYLVVQHMEPDHSGSVAAFAQAVFQPLHGEGDTVDFRRVGLGDDAVAHAALRLRKAAGLR